MEPFVNKKGRQWTLNSDNGDCDDDDLSDKSALNSEKIVEFSRQQRKKLAASQRNSLPGTLYSQAAKSQDISQH